MTPPPPTDKDKWINIERDRWAKYFHIPISPTPPPNFPISTLPIQRALAVLSVSHPQSLESAIDLLYHNTWVQWSEPTKAENLQALLSTLLGGEEAAREVLEQAQTKEGKGVLAGNTQKAYEDGAFGLPYFVGECVLVMRCVRLGLTNARQLRIQRGRRRRFGESITWDN